MAAGFLIPAFEFEPAAADDAEALVALRIAAMRPSLERIGRFDPQRARERFLADYVAADTRHVRAGDERVGAVVLRREAGHPRLAHLYLQPSSQGAGLGSAVMAALLAQADALRLPVHVDALRDSDANRFYRRHGFFCVGESDWDVHYVRPAG